MKVFDVIECHVVHFSGMRRRVYGDRGSHSHSHSPMEDSRLLLNPKREDDHAEQSSSEERKDDPKGSVANMGRMEVVVLRGGLESARIGRGTGGSMVWSVVLLKYIAEALGKTTTIARLKGVSAEYARFNTEQRGWR